MIDNYSELVKSIADELARDDLEYKIPEWIHMAEVSLARYIRMMDGEQFIEGTLVVDQPYIDFPVGFKKPIHIEIQASTLRILNVVSMAVRSQVLQNDLGGLPRAVHYIGRRAYLAPVPTTAEAYHLFYYGLPPRLGVGNETNDLLEMGPDVLKYEALTYSSPFLGDDERLALWLAIAGPARKALRDEYWDARASGGVLRVRTDFAPGDSHDQGAVQS